MYSSVHMTTHDNSSDTISGDTTDEKISPSVPTVRNKRENYLCARPTSTVTVPPPMNATIISTLEELKSVYEMQGDEWRTLGYKKAIAQLKRLTTPLTSVEQLDGLRGIGKRIREKIEEILESGQLKKLKYYQDDPKTQALMEVC